MRSVANGDNRRSRRLVDALVKVLRLADAHRAQRVLIADRQVAVRVRTVEAPGKDALRERGWHLAHLQQPVETKVANAIEVVGVQARIGNHLGEERQRARR